MIVQADGPRQGCCSPRCPLRLQHRGASRLVIDSQKFAFSRHTLGQLGDVGGDPARLVIE